MERSDTAATLYARIRDDIRERIVSGALQPHDRLPSESDLIAEYGVSRITVRQALADLQQAGLIYKHHGKGSFVSKPQAQQSLARLQGFAEAMGEAGYEIVNRVLGIRRLSAGGVVAQRLALETGSPIVEIRRLRHLNRNPLSVEITYVPAYIGEPLVRADLVGRDIFTILENDLGIPLGKAELAIGATAADAETARLIGQAPNSPLLRIERLTYSANGTPIDFEYLFYMADAFQYRVDIDRRR